jgi:hypothetical protein
LAHCDQGAVLSELEEIQKQQLSPYQHFSYFSMDGAKQEWQTRCLVGEKNVKGSKELTGRGRSYSIPP